MIEIDEECSIKSKIKVVQSGNTKRLHVPHIFEENGLVLEPGQEIELNMDKKNKIVYFKYDTRRRRNNGKNNVTEAV